MTPWPGYNCDLDAQTRDALRENNPSALTKGNVNEEHDNVSLLTTVCINNRLDLAEQLLQAGATMTADQFNEVLDWHVQVATITYLLNQGVPHNESSLNVVRSGNWEIVFALLDHGADVQTSIQFWSYSKRRTDIVTGFPFKDSGYAIGRTSLLHIAAWQGEPAIVERLFQFGADVSCRDSDQYTPLLKACDFADKNHKADALSVACLLRHGADPNETLPTGESALALCLGRPIDLGRQTRIAEMLLDFGADPNVSAPTGATPLMFVARDNRELLARKLLQAGARTETGTPDGETALDIARRWRSDTVIKLLQDLV